jgi:hypothetical protein
MPTAQHRLAVGDEHPLDRQLEQRAHQAGHFPTGLGSTPTGAICVGGVSSMAAG